MIVEDALGILLMRAKDTGDPVAENFEKFTMQKKVVSFPTGKDYTDGRPACHQIYRHITCLFIKSCLK